ncbi:MAG TPA: hypothetical protein VMF57_05475 [Solirubrobacteraceae bacterium]|nr:hypothetical protein [Solirubrobacteraceae bacterium]
MSSPEAAPYETLARSIERELELVAEGRFAELLTLQAERDALIARLPDTPPAAAGPALKRAAVTQKRVEIEFRRQREALLLALGRVQQVRRTARGYAPPRQARPRVRATA